MSGTGRLETVTFSQQNPSATWNSWRSISLTLVASRIHSNLLDAFAPATESVKILDRFWYFVICIKFWNFYSLQGASEIHGTTQRSCYRCTTNDETNLREHGSWDDTFSRSAERALPASHFLRLPPQNFPLPCCSVRSVILLCRASPVGLWGTWSLAEMSTQALASTYQTARYHNPRGQNINL